MPLATRSGGAEALLQHLLQQCCRGLDISCAFLEHGPLVELVAALGYPVYVIPTTHLRRPGNYLRTVLALRSWIQRHKLETVFSWMPKAHLYASPAAASLGVPSMWFQHGIPEKNHMNRICSMLPAAAVLCCSEHSKAAQDQFYPHHASFVCYPGVAAPQPGEPAKRDARAALGLPASAHVVGMVARWERWKGIHVFIEAARTILYSDPQAFCYVVGGPHQFDLPYAEELHSQVRMLDSKDRFVLAGQRPYAEVALWQAAADLIVHPAISPEPFGMAVVEAMVRGKVVIATNLGGPSEIIENGISGVLITAGRSDVLAQNVLQLFDDDGLRTCLEGQAVLRGHNFSLENLSSRFEQIVLQRLARNVEEAPMIASNRQDITL